LKHNTIFRLITKRKKHFYFTSSIDIDHMRLLARDLNIRGQRDPNNAKLIRYELIL